jgi:hypothetical protein
VPDPVTVIQEVVVDEVHVQPACDVTVKVPELPNADGVRLKGVTAKLHGADCVTVTLLPATVSVAVREAVVVFGDALKPTVPLPVPLDPLTTLTHPALLAAVHPQPAVVVTATLPDPPAAANACDAGEMLNEHPTPDWVTVKVRPATVSVALRCAVAVVAATANVTMPLPAPVAPVLIDSQVALLAAVQAQPAPADTAMLPVPPADANVCDAGEIAGAHTAVNPKVFDGRLGVLPPGPTADTRVS